MLSLNDKHVPLVAAVRPARAAVAVIDLNGRFLSREIAFLAKDAQRSVEAIAVAIERLRSNTKTRFSKA
jgi:hypothetical protein